MLTAFVLMVVCAVAGMALTFWALRDNLRRTRRTPYRPRGKDTRASATSDESTDAGPCPKRDCRNSAL
jgi:hypothetical protein